MSITRVLGLFLHGLIFSVLGLTVIFLQYRSRRIVLAQRLFWLTGFALCEATVAWNDLLRPLFPGGAGLSPLLRTAILACGYATLLAFGLQTFMSEPVRRRWAYGLLLGVNLLWIVPYGITLTFTYPAVTGPAQTGEVLARYLLAFPGGLLTGFGLREQSYQTLEQAWRQRIRPYLRLAEAAAACFGVLNLILVPAVDFFPAAAFNVTLIAFPASLIWAAVGLLLLIGLVKALTNMQLEIELWVENMEQLQALASDRERISRELHDGIIQSIYAAGLMLESIQHSIAEDPRKAEAQLSRVMESLNHTIQDIRRYIFDLRSDMPDETLEAGVRRLLRDFHINTLLQTSLEIRGEPAHPLTLERRRHIFQIVREALTNTARHAHARQVKIEVDYEKEALYITISDDGVGMEALLVSKGYGLRNIRERARLLDGTFRLESAPDAGLTLHLTIPYA